MDGVSATGNGCATGVKFVTEGKSLSDSRSGCAELRKADAEGRAAPVKAVVDCDRTMMDVDDALDDGEPEACARGLGAERAVEAVEDAFALLGAMPGPLSQISMTAPSVSASVRVRISMRPPSGV